MVTQQNLDLLFQVRVLAGQWFDAEGGQSATFLAHHLLREPSRASGERSEERVEGYVVCFTAILECPEGDLYTGITDILERRFSEHQRGKGGHYTSYNLPSDILYHESFESRTKAENREQQIKRWSRAKKEALIKNDFNRLSKLSVSHD